MNRACLHDSVLASRLHLVHQLAGGEGLSGHVGVGAGAGPWRPGVAAPWRSASGCDSRHLGVGTDLLADLEAALLRHHHVEQHPGRVARRGSLSPPPRRRWPPRPGSPRASSRNSSEMTMFCSSSAIIFGHSCPIRPVEAAMIFMSSDRPPPIFCAARKGEYRALARHRLQPQPTAIVLDDLAADRQAPGRCPAVASRSSPPWRNFSNTTGCCFLDPRAVVLHRDAQAFAIAAGNVTHLPAPVGTNLPRSTADSASPGAGGRGRHAGSAPAPAGAKCSSAPRSRKSCRVASPEWRTLAQVDVGVVPLGMAGLDLGHVEHLVHQARQAAASDDDAEGSAGGPRRRCRGSSSIISESAGSRSAGCCSCVTDDMKSSFRRSSPSGARWRARSAVAASSSAISVETLGIGAHLGGLVEDVHHLVEPSGSACTTGHHHPRRGAADRPGEQGLGKM